jgi:hypothetical protein
MIDNSHQQITPSLALRWIVVIWVALFLILILVGMAASVYYKWTTI